MADGRMLKRAVSDSRRLSELKTDSARLLWTWILPYLDIEGRYFADPELIKGKIVPRIKTFSSTNISIYLEDMRNVGLIILFESDGEQYLQFRNFKEFQTLRPDKECISKIPAPVVVPELSGSTPIQVKLSEVKLREVKLREVNKEIPGIFSTVKNFYDQIKIANSKLNLKEPTQNELDEDILEIDRMIRIDKQTSEQIVKMLEWIPTDPFWSHQVFAIRNLRNLSKNGNKKYINILNQMENGYDSSKSGARNGNEKYTEQSGKFTNAEKSRSI